MELYTRRSIPECLGDGWTLLSTNIGRIAKSMWWPTALMVVYSAIAAPTVFEIEKHSLENNFTISDAIMLLLLPIIITIAVTFAAKIFKLLNEQTTEFCIRRMAKMALAIISIAIIITAILIGISLGALAVIASGTVSQNVGIGLFAIVYIMAIVATIIAFSPMNYVSVKYMIEPEMKLRDIWKAYKQGWKSIGKLIGFTLLSSLVIIIVQCIVSLPGVIAMIAASVSLHGIAYGDPSGLPSAFNLIFGMTAGVSCFITCILMIWLTLSEYYLYGAIEAKYRP